MAVEYVCLMLIWFVGFGYYLWLTLLCTIEEVCASQLATACASRLATSLCVCLRAPVVAALSLFHVGIYAVSDEPI